MKTAIKFLVLTYIFLLTGCGTQNVSIRNTFWQNKPKKVTVAMTKLPTPAMYEQGKQGILDVAIADAVTQNFQTRLKNYKLTNFTHIRSDFINRLQSRGITAINYQYFIDLNRLNYLNRDTKTYALKDFSPYKAHVGSNLLLLISLDQLGAVRPYYGFVPIGPPQAICYAEGRLIDLRSNHILWRQHVNIVEDSKIPWDQPPNYPNFINGLDKAIAEAKTQLLTSFFGK